MKMNVPTPPASSRFKYGNNREWPWLATFFAGLLLTQSAFPAAQYWDTSTASGLQAGTSTWDSATGAWSTGTSGSDPLLVWTDGNDAYFQTSGVNSVTINGTVQVGTLNYSGGTSTTLNGGVLQIGSTTTPNGISGNSTALTINSAVMLNGNLGSAHSTIVQNTNGTLTINGNIGETAAAGQSTLRLTGGKPITLGGSNSFTGGMQIRSGAAGVTQEVIVTNAAAVGTGGIGFNRSGDSNQTAILTANFTQSGTINQNLSLAGGTGNQAIINSSGTATVSFTGAITTGPLGLSGQYGSVGNLDFRLGGSNTGTNVFQTAVVNLGTGVTSLTKQDAGTWILGGANTYTGTTSVSGGTLLINGTTTATSAAQVAVGAKLGGTGTIGGATTVNGTLTAGDSGLGKLTIANNLTVVDGSVSLQINGATAITQYGRIAVTGATSIVSLSGTNDNLLLTLGFAPVVDSLFFLIDNQGSSAISGLFEQLNGLTTDLSEGATITVSGQSFKISYLGDLATNSFTGGNDLVLMATPEANSGVLLLAGMGLLVIGQRLRKRPLASAVC